MEIKEAQFVISNSDVKRCPKPDRPEYAFIGRSNVGKSSLINMMTNKKSLAKTSGKPGKTRLINHFIINNEWYLVDLPGYGYASVPVAERKKWENFLRTYILERENLYCLFV
jgi:GTP-binding protein